MESAGESMEEIYALPPKLKYNESWLEIKEKRGVRTINLLIRVRAKVEYEKPAVMNNLCSYPRYL